MTNMKPSNGRARARAVDVRFHQRLDEVQRQLAPKLRDVPLHDLRLILRALLRPRHWPRRFLLRKIRDGVYVP